jgi:hypothetical protein
MSYLYVDRSGHLRLLDAEAVEVMGICFAVVLPDREVYAGFNLGFNPM